MKLVERDRERAAQLAAKRATQHAALTPREEQAASGVFRGMTNPALASEMGCTEQVVKNLLRRAYRKLGVKSRMDLIEQALRCGGFRLWVYEGGEYRATKFETAAERRAAEVKVRG